MADPAIPTPGPGPDNGTDAPLTAPPDGSATAAPSSPATNGATKLSPQSSSVSSDSDPKANLRAYRRKIGTSETARVLETELAARISGEVRFDTTSRMLYATDASNYQIEPVGVVIPKTAEDVQAAVELAASHNVPILPRGGGSSLAGQCVGAALVIDMSKYLNRILDVNTEERTVTVEPGISLDMLNRQLKSNGLMFGPDPSSGNRATIGGVIGNNASGAHSILYGMTADQLRAARVVFADQGTIDLAPAPEGGYAARAANDDAYGRLLTKILAFGEKHHATIDRDFPRHWRRATGYGLAEFLKDGSGSNGSSAAATANGSPLPELGEGLGVGAVPTVPNAFNVAKLLASSEGSFGSVIRATLDLVPVPRRTGLLLLQFDDLVASMEATPVILEAEPSAIELMDRMLVNLTRKQPGYADQIKFIHGDPAAVLAVEFYGDSSAEVRRKCQHLEDLLVKRGIRMSADPQRVLEPARQADIWSVRKAGLGLLASMVGDIKPIPVIEDVSVPVEHLADYVRAIEGLVHEHGTEAAYYAHASAGCLHIRPLINLKTMEGVSTMRDLAASACELATAFGGVMSGEHGDGLQRSELNARIFGPELYGAMKELKGIFDPRGLMNPGKVVDGPPMDQNLRFGPKYRPLQPKTYLDWTAEGGFLGAVEMCNGAAVCRKLKAGTMCPSFMATKDENDSTRGRANALRNALAGNTFDHKDFTSKRTYDVMDLCLSCKACKTECPSSVDMAKIKTEFQAQYYAQHGTPLRARFFGHIHTMSRFASRFAPLANFGMKTHLASPLMRYLRVHPDRSLPPFVSRTFPKHFKDYRELHPVAGRQTRGKVVYFHDTFTTYNYPDIGMSAVQLLEAAGYEVILEERRVCCGRPMLSKGLVADAKRAARRNVALLAPYANQGIPIIGTEPSCILTLRDEYKDLLGDDPEAKAVSDHSFMVDEFLAKLAAADDLGIDWLTRPGPEVLFHGHCHQKALIGTTASLGILTEAGCKPRDSGAGCCGMAGSFGFETEHYDISQKIAEDRLLPAVIAASPDTVVAVAGVSCRQQIEHFANQTPRHIAQVLVERIAPGHTWKPKPGATVDAQTQTGGTSDDPAAEAVQDPADRVAAG